MYRSLLIILLAVVGGGCIASHQSVVVDVNASAWRDQASVEMINHDTTTLRDISLFVRYSPQIAEDSLHLSLTISTPDSLNYTEQITIYLDPKIEQRGARRVIELPYRKEVLWSSKGLYNITFTPQEEVHGVEAIGVNIVKN